jgi:hypothetical protein
MKEKEFNDFKNFVNKAWEDVLKELETKIDHETLTRLFFERSLHF